MYDILNGITGYDELKEITYEDIEEYRKEVYDIYLPETVLSERANEYIDGITAGALNDYEILQCIRDELSKNTYTLTPGRLPDDVDTPSEFVDYFLFEHPEGYCMHYATIFVLMARSQGIPARYVQGYLVNTEGYREVNVYSTDAHAWAEAYLDGIGWVIFDATPGYGDALSDSWNKNTEFEYARDNDYYREYYDSVSNDALTVSQNEADENGEADVLWLKIIIYISCGIPAAALIIYAVTKSILSANVSRLPLSERALIRCRKNTGLMKWLGIGCIYGATLHETGMEAENILGKEPKFIAIYEKILYSSYEPDDDDMRIIEDDGKMLMLLLKKKSILRYIYAVLFS